MESAQFVVPESKCN